MDDARSVRRAAQTGTLQNMIAYIGDLIAERRAHPGDDLMTAVVTAQIDGRPLREEDITSMMLVILFGGLDTVASAMTFTAHFLAGHPEHRRQLAGDPKIIPHATDELMRRFGVSATARTLTRDFDYKVIHFKRGDKVVLPPLLYGLDDRKFEHPLEVDFSRKNVIHAAFGAGPHRCPGSFLARTEMKMFLEEWLTVIPEFEIDPDGASVFSPGVVNCISHLPLRWPH